MSRPPFPEPTEEELRKAREVARVVRTGGLALAGLLAFGAGAFWLLGIGMMPRNATGALLLLGIGGVAIIGFGLLAMQKTASAGVILAIAVGLMLLTFGVCSTVASAG